MIRKLRYALAAALIAALFLATSACAMQIFVGGAIRPTTLEVEPSDSIERIRVLIQERYGIAPDKQVLSFAGRVLADGNTLQDYSIQKDSMLALALAPEPAKPAKKPIPTSDFVLSPAFAKWMGAPERPDRAVTRAAVYLRDARGNRLERLLLAGRAVDIDIEKSTDAMWYVPSMDAYLLKRSSAPFESAGAMATVSCKSLNLRPTPSTDFQPIWMAFRDEPVRLLASGEDWALVVTANGRAGYCRLTYLVPDVTE